MFSRWVFRVEPEIDTENGSYRDGEWNTTLTALDICKVLKEQYHYEVIYLYKTWNIPKDYVMESDIVFYDNTYCNVFKNEGVAI